MELKYPPDNNSRTLPPQIKYNYKMDFNNLIIKMHCKAVEII